ncbi:MAG TPA: M14 family zinc carboxypeptidase [Ignavibacteriales bacterium]|nr:M14 family zinc carboxypeptidase [Ignavibacteriales bacterium]HOL81755.1 M14 family zinc carboxypeptidase [Ignavibacteriales bacterium]HOM65686.1 M14 family zinc carboxypeptidase [Ignavibacteriales bacterium]HPD67382.1 M14 family zinc carboxypeptidase [Ignavibacteriales bacterium]HRR18775.1 M14 family zinc carboxypeptidase [Ignavibacteriales bacterium]
MLRNFVFFIVILCNILIYSQIIIDTSFEAANLSSLKIYKIGKKTKSNDFRIDVMSKLDPANPVDTALKPSSRWFYFGIENIKNNKLYFNFINSDPALPFYSYDNINFKRMQLDKKKNSFYITPSKNKVYVSYFIPFTHSNLYNTEKVLLKSKFIKIDTIGFSYSNLPIKLYKITNFKKPDSIKKRVWIHSRIHTSESPASFLVDEMIKLLVSNSSYYHQMLDNIIFYVVPFANPDGVKYGLSRSNLQGINLEINWDKPDSLTAIEIKYLKEKFLHLNSQKKFDIVFNSHSQVRNRVTYWFHKPDSTSINKELHKKQLLLGYLGTDDKYFYPPFDQFSYIKPRYIEGQNWLINGDTTVALTFETSYGYYLDGFYGEKVDIKNINKIAKNILYSFNDYLMIPNKHRFVIDNDTTNGINNYKYYYFGKNYLLKNKGDKVTYNLSENLTGNYKIYKWDVDKNGFYKWIFKQKIALKNGNQTITFNVKDDNEFWDAILLVKN